jgi:GMP synthase-like glutamine amidotransferase
MKIHYLIHVAEELPGAISTWAQSKGHTESYTRFYLGDTLPEASAFDMLVVMGGPMNIYEHEKYPWLVAEKELIGKAAKEGKKVFGVCLGAQLMSDALGGKVVRNHTVEIGWFPVSLTPEGAVTPLFSGIKFTQPVLHWHGDRFDVPPGAIHLLSSEACTNQAFLFGKNALALQFHFEMVPETLEKIIELDKASLKKAQWVMTEEEIQKGSTNIGTNNQILFTLLDRFIGM